MSDRYFADLDIHGEVIRFYPDDGKTRLHQNDARRNPVESVIFVRERAIAEAVAAERKQWSDTVANALNWLKHGRIANARDDLKAAQRRAVNEAIRSAAK